MPSPVLLEGKLPVCMTQANKHTSSLAGSDGANVMVLERRWVVLKKEKIKIYDKEFKIGRKKLLQVSFTVALRTKGDVYVENPDAKELYFAFPEKVCVLRFSQIDLYNKWSSTCKMIFTVEDSPGPTPVSPRMSAPPKLSSPVSPPDSNPFTSPTPPLHASSPYPPSTTNSTSSAPNRPRNHTFSDPRHALPTLTSSTNWNLKNSNLPPSKPPTFQETTLDLNTTDDVALLKQEILNLRKKNAYLNEERENLLSILSLEKEFVRDRQNKLDSWETFARLVVFKAVCNSSKNEKLRLKLNKILAKNLPTTKSLKISRMEAVVVNLPTTFEESPLFRLTNYSEEEQIATFMFEWFPQNCTCTIQIDGHKYLGGAIPISFKVAIDLLSKLKIKGEVLVSKGEGNQFLISLPRLPDLTFASPTKLQIGDIFDVSSFTVVQKVVESAVFNTLKKNLLHPKWKEMHF